MASTTKQSLDALVNRVRNTTGFEVKDLGMRWRITNAAGGAPLFVPKRPPQGNTLKGIQDNLAAIGWIETTGSEEVEKDRQARLDRDRERNELALKQAEERAVLAAEAAQRAAAARERVGSQPAGPRRETITIDPKFAAELLEQHNVLFRSGPDAHGRHNRPLEPKTVKDYAGAMLRGEWLHTHQGMAIDVTGFLLDGQHRLAALVLAGQEKPDLEIDTDITYDLPVETMDVIDQVRRRSPTDVLAMHQEVNRLTLASSCRLLYLYDNVPYGNTWRTWRMPATVMVTTLNQHPDLRDAVKWAQNLTKITIASAAATFIYVANRVYREAPMEDFIEGLKTGFNLPPGDGRAALRTRNERIRRTRRMKMDGPEQLALLIKTWNAYLTGTPVQQARFRVDEAFPYPIERD